MRVCVCKKLPSIVNNWTVIDVVIFAVTCDICTNVYMPREFLSKMLIHGQEKRTNGLSLNTY